MEVLMTFEPDPADLALSSIPGHETFDPRRHRFSEEELKSQPIMKKARKIQVPEEQKVSSTRCRTQAWLVQPPQPGFLTVRPWFLLGLALGSPTAKDQSSLAMWCKGSKFWA